MVVTSATDPRLSHEDPHGVRLGPDCHWCRSDGLMPQRGLGLRHDLPQRWRQILTRTRPQSEMPRGPDGRQTADTVPRMGVQANWPLKMWWVTAEKHDPELLELLPPYDELACPRCHGTGKRKDG